MQKIDEKTWEAVRLTEIFDTISRGKRIKKSDHIPGDVPYVSSTALANGTDGSCGNEKNVRKFGDCLTLANSGSVGSCFYHPYDFVASDHVTALCREGTSEDCYLGLSALVGRLGEKYNFNREINDVRISRERVMLPVHEGVPDYEYIEKITQQKRQTMLNKYRIYAQKCIADLGDESELPALSEKTWDSFSISDIFDILPGKRLVAADTTPGDRPFIGALDNSNGIARFVNDTNVSLDKNVLGVNYDGNGMVIGFYHPYECIFSDSVKRFHLKNHEDKAFVLLFMKVAILQQKSKFGYLYPEAQYSTEHGVKGEEYDNVIFVISKGWNQYQFETYAPMITKKAVIPSGKQASFERNRNLFYVCCSRPKKRLIFFVTVPIDSTFKSFLVELVGEQNIFTFSQYIERKSIK